MRGWWACPTRVLGEAPAAFVVVDPERTGHVDSQDSAGNAGDAGRAGRTGGAGRTGNTDSAESAGGAESAGRAGRSGSVYSADSTGNAGCEDNARDAGSTDRAGCRAGLAGPAKQNNPITAESLLAALRERLAPFKVPKRITFVDALPRNAAGKILRTALVEPAPVEERT